MIKARIDLVDYIGRLVLLRRRGGRHWGLCPFHAEKTPSFSVHDRGFFKCFGCGVGGDLIAFVRRLEELSFAEACDKLARNWGIVDFVPTAEDRDRRRRRQAERDRRDEAGEIDRARGALEIWRGAGRGLEGTVAEAYLEGRGIRCERLPGAVWPPTLRYLERAKYTHDGDPASGKYFPMMVAAVQRQSTGLGRAPVVAIHRTYLALDGSGKAPVETPKKMLGPFAGGAIRFAPAGHEIGLAEGIETALSVISARPGLAVWAAGSLEGLAAVAIPAGVWRIRLLMDSDMKDPAIGDRVIVKASARYGAGGISTHVARAPAGMDFNDVLTGAT